MSRKSELTRENRLLKQKLRKLTETHEIVECEELSVMPTEGQFIATWQNNKGIWSGVFVWVDGELRRYDHFTDLYRNFDIYDSPLKSENVTNIKFFKKE